MTTFCSLPGRRTNDSGIDRQPPAGRVKNTPLSGVPQTGRRALATHGGCPANLSATGALPRPDGERVFLLDCPAMTRPAKSTASGLNHSLSSHEAGSLLKCDGPDENTPLNETGLFSCQRPAGVNQQRLLLQRQPGTINIRKDLI
jgi:hypothetical protein